MNTKSNFTRVVEELTAYAVERQAGFEQHQGPTSQRPEERNQWIRGVLRGMAETVGTDPDKLIAGFDQRLAEAKASSAVEPLPLSGQSHIVQALRWHSCVLDGLSGDQRPHVVEMLKLLDDFAAYPQWDTFHTMLYPAKGYLEAQLLRMTAERPIRFTHIVLGEYLGPGGVEFMPGRVNDAAGVRRAQRFQRIAKEHPERAEWPALCTVYLGGGQQGTASIVDADELDMAVIREAGDRFLGRPEVTAVLCEALRVPVHEIEQEKHRPGRSSKRKGPER